MPFCEVSKYQTAEDGSISTNRLKIFYQTYGRGFTKVLLIIGLAGTHDSWGPQIRGLAGTETPNNQEGQQQPPRLVAVDPESNCSEDGDGGDCCASILADDGIEVCTFDNRGVGRSSVPKDKNMYNTTIMATDALALMDHLGWKKAHVFGHSMGAMIASKLASIAPDRVLSLALLNATGGGFECFPRVDRKFASVAIRFLKAKTPEQRAAVDLDTHYTEEYLNEKVGNHTRRELLHQEYVKGISSTGMQSNHGFEGQINACWMHKITSKEYDMVRSSGFLVSIIHGREDIIAQISHARRIAKKLYPVARMVELHGAHLVSHERPEEPVGADYQHSAEAFGHFLNPKAIQVNEALMDLIKASESKLDADEWTNLCNIQTSGEMTTLSWIKRTSRSCSSDILELIMKLQLVLLYFFGLFLLLLQHGKKLLQNLKPRRIAAAAS